MQREIFKINSLGQYLLLNDQPSIFIFFLIHFRPLVSQSAISTHNHHFIFIDISHFCHRHYVFPPFYRLLFFYLFQKQITLCQYLLLYVSSLIYLCTFRNCFSQSRFALDRKKKTVIRLIILKLLVISNKRSQYSSMLGGGGDSKSLIVNL